MREIAGKSETRKALEQMQHKKQVRRHPIAMCFNVHRDAGIISEATPAFDIRDALLEAIGPDIRLQVDMVGAELLDMRDDWSQIINRFGVALRLPCHAMSAQDAGT